MGFLEDLKNRVLVADGAMGTLLYANGIDSCFEALTLSDPDQVLAVHQAYIEAGAQVIQTNTYGANHIKLARYGLEKDTKAINTNAVRLAREAAGEKAYVAGTIGGVRGINKGAATLTEIEESFREQLVALLSEQVDALLLETYYDLEELIAVLALARKITTLPLIVNVSLHEPGILQNGTPLTKAFQLMEDEGADVIGLNCRLGPHHMTEAFEGIPIPKHAYLSAYPNASLPAYVDGKLVYRAEPAYFAESARALHGQGVRLIGGCCGTTPELIAAIAENVAGLQPVRTKQVRTKQPVVEINEQNQQTEPGLHEIVRQKKSVVVELDPPKKLSVDRFFEGAEALKKAGIDALTMADNSLASPRISNMAAAASVKEKFGLRPLVHISCRDRNLIGLQSHLMGLHTLGIDQVLAITGDPTKVGDFPGASSVYDCSSFELIQLCKQFNQGISYSGKSLGIKTSFSVGAAFNPNVHHLDKAVRRLEKKITAGADYFLTQPIFSEKQILDVYEATKHLSVPIYIGIMPLVSSRNAEFLHHEVPGMKLPEEIRERMANCGTDREQAEREGLAIAQSLMDAALELFNGIYLITPFMRYEMSVRLVNAARGTKIVNSQAGGVST
ncbi:MAG TPA: bifunctional homocysteine S-methyltransferase/methylenetetrahydrofolate reductase [Bacillales bacterium]|nr:bifunctional homocysteine S-methyltransferase/methylenetetrahydrofolate reductase [Bacillales bacterium]